MFADFECDHLVAQYALTMTNYQSIEAAVGHIFDTDDNELYLHPFIGIQSDEYDSMDVELGLVTLKCFICQGS